MVYIIFDNSVLIQKVIFNDNEAYTGIELRKIVKEHFHDDENFNFYLLQNGRLVDNDHKTHGEVKIIPRLCGGKGGFGSMLRAIGAQIEKTTNREACRDLSGRRLRDINEEKRLKKWVAEQAEREQEALKRKKKKLEKLNEIVKHEFKDEEYTQARLDMTDKIYESVEQGLKATSEEESLPTSSVLPPSALSSSSSSSSTTASVVNAESKSQNKKKRDNRKKIKGSLWVDDLELLEDTDTNSENEGETPTKKIKL